MFRGGTSGAYFMYDASEDGVVIVAPTDEVALGIRVVGSGQPTVPQFTVGRDTGQYLGIKVDDRISQVIHRQDETDAGIMQMNQEIWDSGTGVGKWNWRYADGAGASASTKMTLNKTGELNVSTSVTSTTFLGDLNGTINTATTGTTQTAGNNSTLIATTAYADAAAAAVDPSGVYLPLAGGTMNSGALIGGSGVLELGGSGVTNLLLDSDGVNIMQFIKASADLQYAQLLSNDDKVRFRIKNGMDIYFDDTAIVDYMEFKSLGLNTTRFTTTKFEIVGLGTSSGETLFIAQGGGAVSLYHDNVLQLATTSTGI
jgi:hypothetical protein